MLCDAPLPSLEFSHMMVESSMDASLGYSNDSNFRNVILTSPRESLQRTSIEVNRNTNFH